MSLTTQFEDIQAWQEARKLTQLIYRLTGVEPFSRDFGLRNQIDRATVSGMTNIAEGFDCDSKREFGRFLGIARRSTVEVQLLLYVAAYLSYIDSSVFAQTYEQARKTKALIGGLKHSKTWMATRSRLVRQQSPIIGRWS
jgi:four helix bundle protein